MDVEPGSRTGKTEHDLLYEGGDRESEEEVVGSRYPFIVIRSEADKNAEYKLWTLATNVENESLGPPEYFFASDIISSKAEFKEAIGHLCRAEVAVFDVTNFEPAVMLLLGIRSVVRHGVTILSLGDPYAIGDQVDIPFNIADANIVAHSAKQRERDQINPERLLADRIEKALGEVASTYYLDLGVFNAVRELSIDQFDTKSSNEGALVLCSFSQSYTELVWKRRLLGGLSAALRSFRRNHASDNLTSEPKYGIIRSFEIESPRLVSKAIYEYIRSMKCCLFDWTILSPNVFFELGIRLAIATDSFRTVCVIESNYRKLIEQLAANPEPDELKRILENTFFLSDISDEEQAKDPDALSNARLLQIAPQCKKLMDLFYMYDYDRTVDALGEGAKKNYFDMYTSVPASEELQKRISPISDEVHKWINEAIDTESQPAARRVYKELYDASLLYREDQDLGISSSLYPRLNEEHDHAEYERLIAVWYFIINYYGKERILEDDEIGKVCFQTIQRLIIGHKDKLEEEPEEDEEGRETTLFHVMGVFRNLLKSKFTS